MSENLYHIKYLSRRTNLELVRFVRILPKRSGFFPKGPDSVQRSEFCPKGPDSVQRSGFCPKGPDPATIRIRNRFNYFGIVYTEQYSADISNCLQQQGVLIPSQIFVFRTFLAKKKEFLKTKIKSFTNFRFLF